MQDSTVATHLRRPLLVSFLAFLLGIEGALAILVGVLAMLDLASVVDILSIKGQIVERPVIDMIGYILGGMSIVIGVVTIALAIGLWMLKRWAFWTAVVLLTINLAIQSALFFRAHTPRPLEIASLIVSALLLLYFLLLPKVRRAFLRRESGMVRR